MVLTMEDDFSPQNDYPPDRWAYDVAIVLRDALQSGASYNQVGDYIREVCGVAVAMSLAKELGNT